VYSWFTGNFYESYGTDRHTHIYTRWDQTVLPATQHKWMCPALTPASKPVLDLPTPRGMEGWVDLGYLAWYGRELNSRPLDHKSDALTTTPPSRQVILCLTHWPSSVCWTDPVYFLITSHRRRPNWFYMFNDLLSKKSWKFLACVWFKKTEKYWTQCGAVNRNGWVMCYGMMDCCVMYWKEGCWVKEQEIEEGYR